MSTRTLYFESVAGVAGDMFAASFVNAGLVAFEELEKIPQQLGLSGVRIARAAVVRASMQATHLSVSWTDDSWKKKIQPTFAAHSYVRSPAAQGLGGHWHSRYIDIDRFLAESSLHAAEKTLSQKIFRLIAEAEAHAHGCPVNEVAFHEVGTVDSILDVVMAARCIRLVAADDYFASPVKLGRGVVQIEHGTHAVPPPAAAWLVQQMQTSETPRAIVRENVELSTPTGLAILRALDVKFLDQWPSGRVLATGSGAGTMDLGNYPNIFRVTLVATEAKVSKTEQQINPTPARFEEDQVTEVVLNVDDQTAERTAWILESLMARGALDAWLTPITGKKGRLATQISVLCAAALANDLMEWILENSSSFGLRYRTWDRKILSRRFEDRETELGTMRFKLGSDLQGRILKEKIEFEDWRKRQ